MNVKNSHLFAKFNVIKIDNYIQLIIQFIITY